MSFGRRRDTDGVPELIEVWYGKKESVHFGRYLVVRFLSMT
jgi:hypothetical protein